MEKPPIKKLVTIEFDMYANILTLSKIEDRSLNAQIRVLLNEALTNRTVQDEK